MNTIKYLVYSGDGSDNLLAWFDEEVEAIAFAKENIGEQTRVEKAECDLAEDGFLNEIIDSKTIWSYLDNNINEFDQEFPEEEPDEFDTDFPESDINDFSGSDDKYYGDRAWELPDSSIKEAVEALEENESEVECKCCFELFPKEECIKTEKGYLCKKCNQELHSHQGTNLDLIDKDPFSLDYEDPRDPEEEEEPEVKEEPVDANEVRKFEAGIEEKLEEHINDRPADIESDQEYQGVDNAVVDCKKYTLVAHSEDEKPVDCKLEKPALEEPLAGEKVDGKFYEELSDEEKKALDEEIENLDLEEAKKDDELPVDPEAAKLEVHTMLNDLVADEIEAINGYEEAKKEILDTPIAHKDNILDTIDHVEDEEKEHVDELISATTEIPFDKESDEVKLEQEERLADEANKEIRAKIENGEVEEEPLDQDFPEVEENLKERVDLPAFDSDVKEGDSILIVNMEGEPDYCGRKGKVEHIDSLGQLHGTWGGLAVIPGVDKFDIITDECLKEAKEPGDKEKSYNDGLKLAKVYNKPVIYGYSNKSYGGKFFALDDPIVCDSVFDETKKFKAQYKSCGVVYVAYPDKDFVESCKLSEDLNDQEIFTPEEQEEYNCDEEGYCEDSYDQLHHCGWCGEVYTESEMRHEADFGWLCSRCEDALKSQGGPLTFIENENLDKKHDEDKWAITIDGEQKFIGSESEMKDKMAELEKTDAVVAHKVELVKGADVLVKEE